MTAGIDLTQMERSDDIRITVSHPNGQLFPIATTRPEERRNQRVMLLKDGAAGFEAYPAVNTKPSTTGIGERIINRTVGAFSGSLKVLVGAPGLNLQKIDNDWRNTWATDPTRQKPTRITVVGEGAQNRHINVYATGISDLPSSYRGIPSYECTVAWKSYSAYWNGPTAKYGPGTHTVIATGDMIPNARLIWDTSKSATATLPHGQTLTLNAANAGKRYIDLSPGKVGHVTTDTGTTDSIMWSQLRGALLGAHVPPHTPTTWTLSDGLTLEVTPRYYTPWR